MPIVVAIEAFALFQLSSKYSFLGEKDGFTKPVQINKQKKKRIIV